MTHVAVNASFADSRRPRRSRRADRNRVHIHRGSDPDPPRHYLLFSDMPGDVRRRWDPESGVAEDRRPSNKCNGMTYDADLNLIVCEHATSLLVRERPDGGREILASRFEGKELNSPNDVCVRSDGSIYFTDPWYGRMPGFASSGRGSSDFRGYTG